MRNKNITFMWTVIITAAWHDLITYKCEVAVIFSVICITVKLLLAFSEVILIFNRPVVFGLFSVSDY